MEQRQAALAALMAALRDTPVRPEAVNPYLASVETAEIDRPVRLAPLALRPEVRLADLLAAARLDDLVPDTPGLDPLVDQAETTLKYAGYVEREQAFAREMHRLENVRVPAGFDFANVRAITLEAREKLARIHPATLGQASRISGVSPADVQALLVLLRRGTPAQRRPTHPRRDDLGPSRRRSMRHNTASWRPTARFCSRRTRASTSSPAPPTRRRCPYATSPTA